MKFGETIRQTTIACFKKCNGKIDFPFKVEPYSLQGKNQICFGDCMNINLEKGPWLKTLGNVPEDAVPKKFIWAHSKISQEAMDEYAEMDSKAKDGRDKIRRAAKERAERQYYRLPSD